MADESQGGGRFGGKKPFPKTFGDVMKGIPSGQGGERSERRSGHGEQPAPAAAPKERRGGQHDRKRAEDARKGPVVIRRPGLGAAKAEGASRAETQEAPQATSPASAPVEAASPVAPAEQSKSPAVPAEQARPVAARPAPRPMPMPEPEPEEEESFAEMFAQSVGAAAPRRFKVGDQVSGVIVQLGQDSAFLDLGGKGEGLIPLAELRDEEGEVAVKVGDTVEGYVLSLAGGIQITKALSKGAQREFLHQARDSGIPVEGLVASLNKGGFEVDLGGVRGFCPMSQIALHFVENPADFVGQRLQFRITELKDRDVVLSRRALLEAEAAHKAAVTRESLHVGLQLEGTVTSVRDFGAFVDIGGLEGLVHVSELGYGRVGHPRDVLQVGQKVTVEVVRIDAKDGEKNERIGLSMKALQQDPWQEAASSLHEGDRVRGKIVRLQPFGAFVEILPGVDGLAHISALGATRRIAHPKEIVAEGEEIDCIIESIDPEQKRISLRRITGDEESLAEQAAAAAAPVPGAAPKVGDVHEVTVDKVESFGLFVKFPGGRGLVPNAEMGTPKGTDHRKQFAPGTTFKAAIVEIDNQNRLRLSKVAAEKAEERSEYQQFVNKQQKESGKGFGTLGDLLKNLKK